MQDAASDQIMRDLRLHAEVEDLEFRNDPALTHGLGQPTDRVGTVNRRLGRKVHGSDRQRCEVRLRDTIEVQHFGPLPEVLMHTSARRDRDDDAWHRVPNSGVDRAPDVSGNLIGLFRNEHVAAIPSPSGRA